MTKKISIQLLVLLSLVTITGCDGGRFVNLGGKSVSALYGSIKLIGITGGTVPLAGHYNPSVSSFYMCDTEITQSQWKSVMGSLPDGMAYTAGDAGGNPVNYISWYDAVVFCNKLSVMEGKDPCYSVNNSYDLVTNSIAPNSGLENISCNMKANGFRLPTEAEWEYAARAGQNYTYSGSNNIDDVAWIYDNSDGKTHEVKNKKANAYGLYDMSGNVWEWCWDWNGIYRAGTPDDPTGATSGAGRILRGGCWINGDAVCSVSYRLNDDPIICSNYIGFRIVCR